jgi:hypothetical protein
MYCNEGSCESPPSCDTDGDCSGGTCEDSLCRYPDMGGGDDDDDAASGGASKWLVGLHVGIDIAQLEGNGVCNTAVPNNTFQCFIAGTYPYAAAQLRNEAQGGGPSLHHNPASPSHVLGESGLINSGFTPSTVRIMASVERALTDKISVEGRLGAAVRTRPKPAVSDMLHVGVAGKYWFNGMTEGLRVFALAGLGWAPVDARKGVIVREYSDDAGLYDIYASQPAYCPTAASQYCELPVDAYKKLGGMYIAGGAGLYFNLGGQGPVLQVAGQVMLPETGLVIQPSGGWVIGF